MSIPYKGAALALLLLTACGSSGGGANGNSTNTGSATFGSIQLIEHEPADQALQIATNAKVTLRFDRPVLTESLRDSDTWLRVAGNASNIAGTFALAEGGTAAVFTPAAPLAAETDYAFQVSALTCDAEGHLLDAIHRFGFRTIDATPPAIAQANLTSGQSNVSRTAPIQLTLTEPVDGSTVTAATVVLRDTFGQQFTCVHTLQPNSLAIQPLAALPGDRQLTLTLGTGIRDRAGNAMPTPFQLTFRTAVDLTAPTVVSTWPNNGSTGISPLVEPVIEFSESMDPWTVEPASVLFQDQYGSLVAFRVLASEDQRTLRLQPQQPLNENRSYVVAFLVGAAAVTDVSGNPLIASRGISFRTGNDITAPAVVDAQPNSNETRVSINAMPTVTFTENLDPSWIDESTVVLYRDGTKVSAVLQRPAANQIRVAPLLALDPSATYQLVLTGGAQGLRDLAGNTLPDDLVYPFATSADATLPGAMLLPSDGAAGVPSTVHASIVFDSQLDPTTVTAATCELRSDAGATVPASVTLDAASRVIRIAPYSALMPGAYYRTFVRGGPLGVREQSGNWLSDDLRARFRIGGGIDGTPPTVSVTVNRIDQSRRTGLVVPTSGFTVDVTASDPEQSLDMGSTRILFTGAGAAPSPSELYAPAVVGYNTLRVTVPERASLAPGAWSVHVEVSDLSGNMGTSPVLELQVAEANSALVPFESTQVVWVRADLDRDGNGRPDFDDDLIRLGLATAADPQHTNATVRALMLDAMVARAHELYGRAADGEPLGPDSVALRITTRQPVAVKHMQIALGGFDPEGSRSRGYGDASTGILGRAYYDYRNANMNDRNLATSPGLGVFPGEMWLYQTEMHRQLYPSFQTMFAQRFLPLCPPMGGTPVGNYAADATVLAAGFDPNTATSEQRARWFVIMQAIDDWAVVNGTVLAHEIGHSIGLVAPGPAPSGLFGDASLHDSNAGATEVMAPSVGYEAMITMSYAFRDIDLAYLRQRLLLR